MQHTAWDFLILIYTWPSYGKVIKWSNHGRLVIIGTADAVGYRLETCAYTKKCISDWQSRSTSTTLDCYTPVLLWYRLTFSTVVVLQRQLLHLHRLTPYSPWATSIPKFRMCYVSYLTETLLKSSKYINVWLTSITKAVLIEKERVVPLWSLMKGVSLQFHCISLLF